MIVGRAVETTFAWRLVGYRIPAVGGRSSLPDFVKGVLQGTVQSCPLQLEVY